MIDLSGLPSMPPDAGVSDRIRERCHAQLKTGHRTYDRRGDRWLFAAAGVYLIAAILQALAFLR